MEGEATANPRVRIPENYKSYLHVWKEIVLYPGQQYTLAPNTRHWFQARDEGTIISEFSSSSNDEADIFSDTQIARVPGYD